MTGSMVVKGRSGNILLRIIDDVVSADGPTGTTPKSYTQAHFEQDLEFALANEIQSRSPIEGHITFLQEFKRLYEIASGKDAESKIAAGKTNVGEESKAEEAVDQNPIIQAMTAQQIADQESLKSKMAFDEERATQQTLKQDEPKLTMQQRVAEALDNLRRKTEENHNEPEEVIESEKDVSKQESPAADLPDLTEADHTAAKVETKANPTTAEKSDGI